MDSWEERQRERDRKRERDNERERLKERKRERESKIKKSTQKPRRGPHWIHFLFCVSNAINITIFICGLFSRFFSICLSDPLIVDNMPKRLNWITPYARNEAKRANAKRKIKRFWIWSNVCILFGRVFPGAYDAHQSLDGRTRASTKSHSDWYWNHKSVAESVLLKFSLHFYPNTDLMMTSMKLSRPKSNRPPSPANGQCLFLSKSNSTFAYLCVLLGFWCKDCASSNERNSIRAQFVAHTLMFRPHRVRCVTKCDDDLSCVADVCVPIRPLP